jgi:hypothetical protein
MREFLIRVTRKLLQLLAPETISPQADRVRELVEWANEVHAKLNGERKRHQVLNMLISEFPDVRKRDLAFEIEKVLQEIE